MERRFRKRQSQFKAYSKRVLILCEGETEVNYFRGLKFDDEMRRRLISVDINIYQPENYSPRGLVDEAKRKINEAKNERNTYDVVWVVFDKDQHGNLPAAFALAEKYNINIAFSNICFEFWILLHFEKVLRHENECNNMLTNVRKYYPDYEKSGNHYERLKDKINIAITNGKWVLDQTKNDLDRGMKKDELSAYTDVHVLVEYLISL